MQAARAGPAVAIVGMGAWYYEKTLPRERTAVVVGNTMCGKQSRTA